MKWISVKDRLPEFGRVVIVDGGIAYYSGEMWYSLTGCAATPISWEVKDWMPLPPPPQEER